MSYSDFSLSSVKKAFDLTLIKNVDLFTGLPEVEPGELLEEILRENLPIALASNTEKARSELIIAPILVELRRKLERKISLFSGINFSVEPEMGLNGNCDFIISLSEEILFLTSPVITLVEAKKEDLNGGLGQCVAEMVGAQIFNLRENNSISTIYGTVTSGTNWRFLKLEEKRVYIDLTEYYLGDLSKVLGILSRTCRG